jgi:hypothetical protein
MRALALLAVLVPAIASAQSFEASAEKATVVKRLDDVIWAFVGTCTQGDEIQQRQCRLVRAQRQKALAGATLLVDGETSALELSKWNAQKRSLGIVVTSCIRCAGVDVEGKKYFVAGTGTTPRWEGNKLRTQLVHEGAKTFDTEAAAAAWTKSLEHARVQYLVKVPQQPKWAAGGKDGFSLEVIGFRVIGPCDGQIVAAKPASQAVPADAKACSGAPAPVDPTPGKKEKLPDALTGQMIKAALQPVLDAANACFQRNKITGKGKLVMTVDNEGKIVEYAQEGDFVGTPTETCIDTAAKKVTFPRTQKPTTKVGFPIVLQ